MIEVLVFVLMGFKDSPMIKSVTLNGYCNK